jgi:uncharacterized RDD family membrane protein YckC
MADPLITILDSSNTPIGPLPLGEVQHRLQTGELNLNQLAFVEGLSAWTPLSSVLAYLQVAPPPLAPAPALPTPTLLSTAPLTKYAGFWLRFVAYFLDSIVLTILIYGPVALLTYTTDPSGFLDDMQTGHNNHRPPFWVELIIVAYVIPVALGYFAVLESSSKQGTLGKMALGLKVTDLQGQRLTFSHALGRTAAKLISNLTCCVFYFGYILAGITEKKQALHDMIAGTLVWRR